MANDLTATERMVVAIAREIQNGDVLLEGIGTFLPTAAYMLAQSTHAPDAMRLCPVGNTFVRSGHRLTCSDYEFSTIGRSIYNFDYHEVNGAYLPTFLPGKRGRWIEFLRPAQVDATGRTNNVVIGDIARPRVRLPGAAGLPDGTPLEPEIMMYVPRHDRRTFVERLDFVSAPGTGEGAHPHLIVTDLGVLGFDAQGHMEVQGLSPGVTRERIVEATGFALKFNASLVRLPEPTDHELDLLRTVIDPTGLRDAENHTGAERLRFLETIVHQEQGFQQVRTAIRGILAKHRGG